MKILMIIDDATLGVQGQKDRETPGGISPIAEMLFMGQKLGIGGIIVSHTLSGLSQVIRQNIETWMVTRLPAEDPRLVCNLMCTTPEQAEKLKILRPGELVIFNPMLWHKPVYATFSQPSIQGQYSEFMREAAARRFLSGITTQPPAPPDTFRPNTPAGADRTSQGTKASELPSVQIELLVVISSGLPKTVGKICRLMGVNRTRLGRVVKALEATGVLAGHRFSTGRIGGQLCFFEIKDPGWKILQSKGLSRPASLTNGGFEHELAAQLLRAEAQALGFAVGFEVDIGGLRLDTVMVNRKTGQRHYFNIGISRPEHEVDSIEKFFTLSASHDAEFTLVVRDSTFAKKVKRIFEERRIKEAIVKSVQIRLIADFVNE